MMTIEVARSRVANSSRGEEFGSMATSRDALSTGWLVMPLSTSAASVSRPWRASQ
jgi:hypothetical protein